MTRPFFVRITAALFGFAALLLLHTPAASCACCSNRGSRHVAIEKLDAQRQAAVAQIMFGKTAQLYSGEGDGDDSQIDGVGSDFALDVERKQRHIVFTFRNSDGQPGTATLVLPHTISIFEVDPHGSSKDEGLGPSLYKEWTLTAPVNVTGILRRAGGPRQTMSLVLHGAGRGCTDATHFTHWTLQFRGPNGQTILFGPLESGNR